MMITGLAVFLFGTVVSAGPLVPHFKAPAEIVISKHSADDKVIEYNPATGGSPLISNYIQQGTNVFFKPQFMLSAAQMPPQVQAAIAEIEKHDCKTPLPMGPFPMFIEEPLKIMQQEIIGSSEPIIKEIIEINPEKYYHKTPTASSGHGVHIIELPSVPVLVKEASLLGTRPSAEQHDAIPEAPVLSPFEMPVSVFEESDKPKEVVSEVVIIPAPEKEVSEAHIIAEIPPAPVLPPLEMPTMPMLVEPAKDHIEVNIKPMDVPEVTLVPSLIPEAYVREVILSPPEAPVLPPMDLPETILFEKDSDNKPVEIPPAPLLPPFEMPKLPEIVVVDKNVAVPEAALPCEEIMMAEEVRPKIPEAPLLAPYIPVESPKPSIPLPIRVVVENEISELLTVPAPPELSPFTMPELPLETEESKGSLPPFVSEVIASPPSPILNEENPLVIPEAPVLPPLSLPELPMKFDVIEPIVIPEAPIMTPFIPAAEPQTIMIEKPVHVIVENKITNTLANIPAHPQLSPFQVPGLPIVIDESKVATFSPNTGHVSYPLVSEVIVSQTSPIVIDEKPMVIPEAPVLLPLSLPEVPMTIQVSETNERCEIVEVVKPILIPVAPVLAPYNPVDVQRPIIVEEPVRVVIDNKFSNTLAIPAPPELTAFQVPQLPVVIEEFEHQSPMPEHVSELIISQPSPVFIEEKPKVIPEAPVLAPLSLSEIPMSVHVSEKVEPCETVEVMEPLRINEAPLMTPYAPTSVFVAEPVPFEVQKHVEIPSPPVLPPLELPKAPIVIEEVDKVANVIDKMPIVMNVPYAFKETSLVNTHDAKPIVLTSAPEFLVHYIPVATGNEITEEPTSCVHDIVVERILPKLQKSLNPSLGPVRYAMF